MYIWIEDDNAIWTEIEWVPYGAETIEFGSVIPDPIMNQSSMIANTLLDVVSEINPVVMTFHSNIPSIVVDMTSVIATTVINQISKVT